LFSRKNKVIEFKKGEVMKLTLLDHFMAYDLLCHIKKENYKIEPLIGEAQKQYIEHVLYLMRRNGYTCEIYAVEPTTDDVTDFPLQTVYMIKLESVNVKDLYGYMIISTGVDSITLYYENIHTHELVKDDILLDDTTYQLKMFEGATEDEMETYKNFYNIMEGVVAFKEIHILKYVNIFESELNKKVPLAKKRYLFYMTPDYKTIFYNTITSEVDVMNLIEGVESPDHELLTYRGSFQSDSEYKFDSIDGEGDDTDSLTPVDVTLDQMIAEANVNVKAAARKVVSIPKKIYKEIDEKKERAKDLVSELRRNKDDQISKDVLEDRIVPFIDDIMQYIISGVLAFGAFFPGGPLVGIITFIISKTILGKKNKERKNMALNVLKREIEIIDEKIQDARNNNDIKSRDQLKRYKFKLETKLAKLRQHGTLV
jgi:hypothetical protein